MSKCDFCEKECGQEHCHTESKEFFDPPSGWKYGFPKQIPHSLLTKEDWKKWLKDCGYPEKDLDFALKYGRIIYE